MISTRTVLHYAVLTYLFIYYFKKNFIKRKIIKSCLAVFLTHCRHYLILGLSIFLTIFVCDTPDSTFSAKFPLCAASVTQISFVFSESFRVAFARVSQRRVSSPNTFITATWSSSYSVIRPKREPLHAVRQQEMACHEWIPSGWHSVTFRCVVPFIWAFSLV